MGDFLVDSVPPNAVHLCVDVGWSVAGALDGP